MFPVKVKVEKSDESNGRCRRLTWRRRREHWGALLQEMGAMAGVGGCLEEEEGALWKTAPGRWEQWQVQEAHLEEEEGALRKTAPRRWEQWQVQVAAWRRRREHWGALPQEMGAMAELEMSKARNHLDAVLQCLLEKSDVDRDQLEEEAGKTPSDAHSKDCSLTSAGKRPSARFPHHRRKKRKEMEDGLAEGGQQRPNTYTIKLFDRSVDLAQFSENTPLYPICRAWMRNCPSVREPERSPSPPPAPRPEDEEGTEVTNGKSRDVYKLPPPTAPCPSGEAPSPRIPSPLRPEGQEASEDPPPETAPTMSSLIYRNMERWKRIRQRWKEASHRNQLRYSESMKILREMYERQ
ncbi:protein lin-37 homolog isoform X4 [Antechinus flavipes]|uniref:protein lin-37 homolog isoform X4 n=1 Tax=Antechinus flavipes TaxID=38775 RepID=UPI0022361583|nr:protein lin-37 homolog isoform X4 [Antechinus flavipes]